MNETDTFICINGFQMSIQTTLTISCNIPTPLIWCFSTTLNAL